MGCVKEKVCRPMNFERLLESRASVSVTWRLAIGRGFRIAPSIFSEKLIAVVCPPGAGGSSSPSTSDRARCDRTFRSCCGVGRSGLS